MKSTLRMKLSVMALTAGLVGVTACGNASPAAPTSTTIARTSPATTAATSSTPVVSTTAASSDGSGVTSSPARAPQASAASSGSGTASTNGTKNAQREVNPAGDIPDNQAFVPYTSSKGKFSVTVPEGWARTDTASGVLFTDKYNSIRVETRSAVRAPTAASIRSSEVPTLSRSAANFHLGDITAISRKAGAAVLLTYRADTAPNAVTGKVTAAAFERYVFFKAGTEVDITVGAPIGGDNVDPWLKITDSFSWSV